MENKPTDHSSVMYALGEIKGEVSGINNHLTRLNSRTSKNENRLTLIEAELNKRQGAQEAIKKKAKSQAVKWGTGAGAAIAALLTALNQSGLFDFIKNIF